ncbi:helix-turn-helix domain-containing protein [Pedobacter jamesrossensis]|uniref:Helix-turn-helix domain-containing protein n=1 Tax=Pedobacter jamesrossensis TaxID=1908238 RepID=A0ABV8NS53_9SPHI
MYFLNFLVSTTCFFLLLFAVHLFFAKKGNKTNNILLSLLFFARFGQILTSLIITSNQQQALSILFQFFTPLYFAAPACLYLYVTGFLTDRKGLHKNDWLHFIPGLLAIIHVIPWPGTEVLNWQIIAKQLAENGYLSLFAKSGLFPSYFHNLGRTILILVYLFLCWRAISKSKIRTQTSTENPGKDWIFFLLGVATLFQLMGMLPIILRTFSIPFYHSSFISLNCIVLLGILSYAIHKPKMFYGYLLVAIDWDKKTVATPVLLDQEIASTQPTITPKKSFPSLKKNNLSPELLLQYTNLIKRIMEDEQIYLKQDLQIIDLATKLNIPVHHCSYVLNNEIGKNFRDWINSYRIEYFLKQYPILGGKITIEAVAQESGFKNLATFYNAFKKEKGVLPTDYFARNNS